jgi:hypothetical protein
VLRFDDTILCILSNPKGDIGDVVRRFRFG